MPKVEVCFTPNVYHLFHNDDAIVVVIDVLRATSAITTAFFNGVSKMIPVATVEEAKVYKDKGFIVAAERNGEIVEGFDLGNSPFSYMNGKIKGETVVITTTNGTQAIEASKKANQILIGSFLNQDAIIEHIVSSKRDVLLLCSGWKNKFNLEDTLFAGGVADILINRYDFETHCDSAIAASQLYHLAKHDLFDFLSKSSHRHRLEKLNLERDIRYCLTPNQCPVIPALENDYLIKL
ncbi:MAG: 2-phosphosulfolactate phosphatase [Bacteroidia bacterium]